MYEIERGIPVPAKRGRYRTGLASKLRQMKPGDSMVISPSNISMVYQLHAQTAMRFTTRKQPDGTVRIWRIA